MITLILYAYMFLVSTVGNKFRRFCIFRLSCIYKYPIPDLILKINKEIAIVRVIDTFELSVVFARKFIRE
ncbi:hypothetical protein QVD17_03696 [Tagetes erecta]|uniref:Secreted protein n=1 Tax=Tagetes erecta TaxID=13708 RepID=A0AAD8PA57_TARER|nr:hypothetical protein QVD17_03696 [Tagetes erecta]